MIMKMNSIIEMISTMTIDKILTVERRDSEYFFFF